MPQGGMVLMLQDPTSTLRHSMPFFDPPTLTVRQDHLEGLA
jgi:hypothetical protein